jgi:hypothetical protein
MTIDPKLSHKINLVIHSLGLSCLGGAIFLQILVFSNILLQGYFRAVETNSTILTIEITLTVFTAIYFLYTYQKVIRTFITH